MLTSATRKVIAPPCYTGSMSYGEENDPQEEQGEFTQERCAQLIAQAELPTRYGRFTIYGFKGRGPQEEAVALVRGNLQRPRRRRWFACTRSA